MFIHGEVEILKSRMELMAVADSLAYYDTTRVMAVQSLS
jgi:hypothetical protein